MTGEPPALERELTAILNADVDGYSRLMGDDEGATVRPRAAYSELIAEVVGRHHGRVVDFTGDNLLAEFASVVGASSATGPTSRRGSSRWPAAAGLRSPERSTTSRERARAEMRVFGRARRQEHRGGTRDEVRSRSVKKVSAL
jgi:class 3 adenylate cyclase